MKKLVKRNDGELQDLFKNELESIHWLYKSSKEKYFIELEDFFFDDEAIYMIEKRPKCTLKEYVLKASAE